MATRPVRAALIVTAILLAPSIATGAVTGGTDVIVRIYDASGVFAGTKHAALELARQTLEAASIDVIWRLCANHHQTAASSRCDDPMGRGELAIRIVRSPVPANHHGSLPLGDALIDAGTKAGVLATIYFDRVTQLSINAGADAHILLGRAIAHELGHLLMATSAHGPVGLMRAFWSQDEMRRSRRADWMFAPAELAAIRAQAGRSALGSRREAALGTR